MFKKIALIVLFIGVTVGVAFLLYRFFFVSPAPVVEPEPGVTTPGTGLPTAGEGRPPGEVVIGPDGLPISPGIPTTPETPIVPEAPTDVALGAPGTVARSATVAADSLNYYDENSGRFYGIGDDGEAKQLSSRTFAGVNDVTWTPDGRKAVIEFLDQSNIVFDFNTQKQVTLPKHWEGFGFSADGETVIAKSIGLDPENRWLVAANADGTGTRLIESLGENGDKVTVSVSPDSSIVAFSDTGAPVGFDTRDLLPIGQNQENFPALRVEGFDFIPSWSPEGDRLVYSVAGALDDYLPALWAVRGGSGGSVGANRVRLNINTWADKCAYADEDTMYCAEPISLPRGAGLQRDIADATPDRLMKIDLSSGTISNVTPQGFDSTVRTLKPTEDGNSLLAIDASGRITKVELP